MSHIDIHTSILLQINHAQAILAYQPTNPYTVGILGLLYAIYAIPN